MTCPTLAYDLHQRGICCRQSGTRRCGECIADLRHEERAQLSPPKPAPSPLPDDWMERDSAGSYYDAIAACRERYKAGEPLGSYFRSIRDGDT